MEQFIQSGATIIFAATLIASLLGLFQIPKIINVGLFRPYWFLRAKQYHTIITSGFIHADLSHLLFNMFTFYFFAFDLERHIGAPRFVLLYVTGLLLSHSCTYFKHKNNQQYASLGASGAISAVLFAYIVLLSDNHFDYPANTDTHSGSAVRRRLCRLLLLGCQATKRLHQP